MRGAWMVVVALTASAADTGADVGWQAPDECGAVEDLAARVATKLAHTPRAEELIAEIAIIAGEDGHGYRATFARGGAARTLTGATCGEIVDALALILALAIRDDEEARPAADQRRVEPKAPSPARSPRPVFSLGARAGFDFRALPAPALGFGPELGLRRGAWRVGAALELWDSKVASPLTSRAAEVDLTTGAIAVCRRVGAGRGCAVALTGPVTATSLDAGGRSARRWWTATGASVGATGHVGSRIEAAAEVSGLISLVRPRFQFDDDIDGYRVPAFTVRLGITLSIENRPGH